MPPCPSDDGCAPVDAGLWDQPAPRPPRETAHPARPARAHGPTRASAGAWSSSRRASAPPGAAAPGRRHSSLAFVSLSLFSSALAAPLPRLWGPFVLVDAILTPTREPSLISFSSSTGVGTSPVLLEGQYVLVEEKSVLPEIAPYLKIKFPTADQGKGLGAGEFDETVGVGLRKTLFPRFVSYLTLAYTFIGSPAGTSLDNSFGWSVGAAYLVARPFSVFAFLDGSTAISPGQANPLEVRVGADYRVAQALKIFGSVSPGLGDAPADLAV